MTRIVVKNLPKSVTADKLRQTFSQKGQVTDLQLKYTPDGKFRHFAFVGFKTDDEAEAALTHFNNTFIGSCKIQVERCYNLGDAVRASSRQKKLGTNPDIKATEDKQKKESSKEDEDPEFAEFMKLHSRGGNATIWSNGATESTSAVIRESSDKPSVGTGDSAGEDQDDSVLDKEANKKEMSDLEYLKSKMVKSDSEPQPSVKKTKPVVEFLTVKVRGFPFKAKKKEVKQFFAPLKLKSLRIPPKVKGIAYVGLATEKDWKQALNKNRSFFGNSHITVQLGDIESRRLNSWFASERVDSIRPRLLDKGLSSLMTMTDVDLITSAFLEGHRITVMPYTKKDGKDGESSETDKKKEQWQKQHEALALEESVAESGRMFIRNLAYSVTTEDLEALFSKYGPLAEVHLPVDKFSRKLKGFAFVTFVMPEHATKAYTELDGTAFQGRMLHLLPAKAKNSEGGDDDEEGTSYKKKKQKELKSQAGSAHNWNTLFLGANAVANLMADRYDTSKQQILSDHSSKQSVAVRLALGETQLVAETKNFLEENGVVLKAFDSTDRTQRSKTVILVKNLETGTRVDDIHRLFEPHGQLGRVLLPPNGVTALLEFLEPAEAKVAFRKLAYTKFRNIPLYLEWAPVGVFSTPAPPRKEEAGQRVEVPEPVAEPAAEEVEPEPETTLFVKNLNFETTDESLRKHFDKCGQIFSATVARKKDPKNPGQLLSMGYGFVQFVWKKGADTALKELQNSVLDEHTIELKRSNRVTQADAEAATKLTARKQTAPKGDKEAVSGKILVRNIPFEAKTSEVADLFKTFGELKAVRLPKKTAGTGSHRGFAFVEFLAKEDAKKAFGALKLSTHLYGRRLVLEWAATEETVEDVRRRTAAHFNDGPASKRSKTGITDYLAQLPDDS